MFVVEVWTLVVPSAFSTSAGSPELVSVIATNELHVRWATWRSETVSPDAAAAGARTSSATSAAINRDRMAQPRIPRRCADEPRAFRHLSAGGHASPRCVAAFHP